MEADRTFSSKRAYTSCIRPHLNLCALALALAPTSQAIAQLMLEEVMVTAQKTHREFTGRAHLNCHCEWRDH